MNFFLSRSNNMVKTMKIAIEFLMVIGFFVIPTDSWGQSTTVSDIMRPEEKGELIYRANCFTCHGSDPSQDGLFGPSIQGASKELLMIRLQKGGRHYPSGYKPKRDSATMPPQAHLIPQIENLMAYLNMDHAEARAKKKPLKSSDPVVERGKQTFAMCAPCHQPNGEGKVGLAPSLTDQDFLALASDDFIADTISHGRPGTSMISFAFLNENQVSDIIHFLRSFQRTPNRKVDHNWTSSGDRKNGEELYVGVCAQCHGDNGKGYILGGSGTGIGLNGFLDKANDGYIKAVILSGREGTPMRAFGDSLGLAQLSDQGINDIIVYLRYLGKKNANEL
jgi:mono/diheme cytochrome c family protein